MKSISLKLTKGQLEAVELLLSAGLKLQPQTVQEKLLHELIDKIYERVRLKVKKVQGNSAKGYGMTLNSVESKALYLWYYNLVDIFRDDYTYECMVVDDVAREIDQVYA